jgi:hypothetical protein
MNKQLSVPALVERLKHADQDFEWYPTTPEIISCVKRDISHHLPDNRYGDERKRFSLLDCGAGDGRVLRALTEGDRYAIELADIHLQAIGPDIFIVGTDFREQSLIDKHVDVLFSNPPYSEYDLWAAKIIREANAGLVYLVIPTRWTESRDIQDALTARGVKAYVISTFDFTDAPRAARATVNIIRVKLREPHHPKTLKSDPFDVWFESTFDLGPAKDKDDDDDEADQAGTLGDIARRQEQVVSRARQQLVAGGDYVQALENLYNRDMEALFENYRHFEAMDTDLLREVGVTAATVKQSLKARISGLKDIYWKTFFDTFSKITARLISSKRKHMLGLIMQHVHIDFTARNAYAIAVWAIKNANLYFDEQLITVFERLLSQANVTNYVSNKNTFSAEKWRYNKHEGQQQTQRVKLEFRVILEYAGGIVGGDRWDRERYNGLSETGVEYIRDLRTVADNLGFEVGSYQSEDPLLMGQWESNKVKRFHALHKGKQVVLMEVRGFYNRNFHIKFNQAFLLRFNVEFGRLKGWLRDRHEAAAELAITPEEAAAAFKSNILLTGSPALLLGLMQEADNNGKGQTPKGD